MTQPTAHDWAYFAAYVDGEGCIRVCGNNKRGSTPSVSVKSTFPFIVLEMRALFGGGVRYSDSDSPKHKTQYEWTLYGPKALEFLTTLIPHLREKRPQAYKLLEWSRWPRKSEVAEKLRLELSAMKEVDYGSNHPV